MKEEDIAICRKIGCDPDLPHASAEVARYRAFCEAIGTDADAPDPDPKEALVRGIEWQLSACDPDRTCNTYAMIGRLHAGGQEEVDRFLAELDAERAKLFAEYEFITGRAHPHAKKA